MGGITLEEIRITILKDLEGIAKFKKESKEVYERINTGIKEAVDRERLALLLRLGEGYEAEYLSSKLSKTIKPGDKYNGEGQSH